MKFEQALTPKLIDAAPIPPRGKTKKLADGEGLYLFFKDTGRKYWRLKFRLAGDEQTYSIGVYPDTTIDEARAESRRAKKLISQGISPIAVQREAKTAVYVAGVTTFGKVGREFLDKTTVKKAPATRRKLEWQFECLADIHARPVGAVTNLEVISILKEIQRKGHREAAHRVGQFAKRVFRHALNNYEKSVIDSNPVADLREVLDPREVVSHAGYTDPKQFGQLMRWLDEGTHGFPNVRHGLQLLARTALRPGELRQGLWSEVNFEKAEWRVPAGRMKMRREHLVPLSTQVIAILRKQHAITGGGPLMFPGLRSGRPMSDAAMGNALKDMMIPPDEHVPHGFRSSFSTLLNEAGEDSAVIELQLSHAKGDKIAGIYDRSQRNPDRRKLMQRWSDYIDELKTAV